LFLPYKVKNPIKHFPIVTVTIIGLNVVVYLCTTDYFLFIRESVVDSYGYAFAASPWYCYFSAIFLHADPLHLLGNMLFLWIFGPPVEDRLGKVSYLLVYLATGFAGDLLQAVIDQAVLGHPQPGIGASGCIMGVVGAYWYIFSWSKVCVWYWFWYWFGVWEIRAFWVIGFFFAMDLMNGVLYGSAGVSGGVANFAHLGGTTLGVLMCMVMHVKRDSEDISDAKAVQADVGNLSAAPLSALQAMLTDDPGNPEVIRAMIPGALSANVQNVIHQAMEQAGAPLIDRDPKLVAHYLLDLQGNCAIYQPVHLLHLCNLLQQAGDPARAISVYKSIVTNCPTAPETEAALYRMASCYWSMFNDAQSAKACLAEMDRRFPFGDMAQFGKTLMRQLG
jgi:membrane associated rhomboid family serine protease